jgi:hypothetical protein
MIAETDLISALPRRFVALHATRFGVIGIHARIPLGSIRLNATAPEVAMMDKGRAWLFGVLARTERPCRSARNVRRTAENDSEGATTASRRCRYDRP